MESVGGTPERSGEDGNGGNGRGGGGNGGSRFFSIPLGTVVFGDIGATGVLGEVDEEEQEEVTGKLFDPLGLADGDGGEGGERK